MGAWSHEPFGNDDACDWAYALQDTKDPALIEKALDRILESDEYIEAPEACEAVAAAEVLAKILGKGTQSDSYTRDVDAWVRSSSVQPTSELLMKAKRALDRVIGEDSELCELWEEGDAEEWIASITALQRAIHDAP